MIDYLQEENRVLREQLGPRRMRFNDHRRVRLAAKAKKLSRHALTELGAIVIPDTCSRGIGRSSPASTTGATGAGRAGQA